MSSTIEVNVTIASDTSTPRPFPIRVEAQVLVDVIVTAVESGSYGSFTYQRGVLHDSVRERWSDHGLDDDQLEYASCGVAACVLFGEGVRVYDREAAAVGEDGISGTLTRDPFVAAFIEHCLREGESLTDPDIDVVGADFIVQRAALGEVVFA